MPRAVLRNGVIYPLDPLPPDWADGKELRVEETDETVENPQGADRWFDELEAMVAQNDPEDIKKLEEALQEADKQAKEWMRREMGNP
jgi:hypothetical protein